MPTFIAYRNGSKAGEIVGANSQMLEVRCPTLEMYLILDY